MHLTDDRDIPVLSKSVKISSGIDTVSFRFKLSPGFYRAYFHIETADGKKYPINNTTTGSFFNVGCRPGEIVSPQDKQPDFDKFWSDNLAELASVSPDYRLELLPERSDSIRRTYIVHMKSLGGISISGIYIEPVKDGKYPVFITYMGYGSDPWYEDPDSDPNSISFQLSVRGQGLCKANGAENDWVVRGLGSRDTYYYKFAFADVVRVVDFVASREKTDPDEIFAEGGSQGGAFTLIAASLDHRIRAIAPFVPFLSDFPDYFKMAEWPANQVLPEAESLGIPDADLYRMLSYFDVKNFTDRITCPVLMGFGLQDTVCPPHAVFSGYNLIDSPKTYICFPMSGHHVEREAGWWKAVGGFFGRYTE
ncbi:MAG: acetylxylan esterase [Bacteroidales bacterium]|nr:acetylxylan esterase [Bacteroidales bacterium]MCI1785117.1 acetylxylan esterase [Bacteroidales bacterium]